MCAMKDGCKLSQHANNATNGSSTENVTQLREPVVGANRCVTAGTRPGAVLQKAIKGK